jgi:hypothetical protein
MDTWLNVETERATVRQDTKTRARLAHNVVHGPFEALLDSVPKIGRPGLIAKVESYLPEPQPRQLDDIIPG